MSLVLFSSLMYSIYKSYREINVRMPARYSTFELGIVTNLGFSVNLRHVNNDQENISARKTINSELGPNY